MSDTELNQLFGDGADESLVEKSEVKREVHLGTCQFWQTRLSDRAGTGWPVVFRFETTVRLVKLRDQTAGQSEQPRKLAHRKNFIGFWVGLAKPVNL